MKYLLALLLICLLGLTPAYADDSADDSTGTDESQVYQVSDNVMLISTVKFAYGKPRIVAKLIYPELETDADENSQSVDDFNKQIADNLSQEVASFKKAAAEYQTQAKSSKPLLNNLYIDYDTSLIRSNKHPVISVRFSIQGNANGMPHPYHYHRAYNYDVDNGKMLSLDDLFEADANYLATISEYTREQLLRRVTDKANMLRGTSADAANFRIWNIKPNGLLFTFDAHQIGSAVQGAQTVLVPFDILKTMMVPDNIIADCIKHTRKCTRNNLLTGGFIDTAVNSQHSLFDPILSDG